MSAVSSPFNFDALDACHQQIQRHLANLSALAQQIEADGVNAQAQQTAADIEAFFSATARQHHQEEEKSVFPALLSSGDADLASAVRSLQQDHGWIEENWLELAPQLRAIALGNSWYDSAEFQHGVQVFLELVGDHIALEESLIYPESKARWAQVLASRAERLAQASTT
ncbi:MAG: hemerythrin domain-containing protein [Betaproteobacteria bacterium]